MALDKKLKDFDNALSRLEEAINKTNAYKEQEEYAFLEILLFNDLSLL